MSWMFYIVLFLPLYQGIASGDSFPPRIDFLMHPTISDGYVNTSITLTCSGYYMNEKSGMKPDVDVLWYFNKETSENPSTATPSLITSNTRSQSGSFMFELSEPRNSTLHFIAASDEYNGDYYCVISKIGLSAESVKAVYRYGGSTSQVFVVEPSFQPPLSSHQTLTCQTNPSRGETPDIQWFYNPANETHFNIANNEYAPFNLDFYFIMSFGNPSMLQFEYVSADYDGEYYCKAKFSDDKQFNSKTVLYKYSAGQDQTNSYPFSVSIQVLESGTKKELDNNVYLDVGKIDNEVSFICTYSSFSTISDLGFKWIFTPRASTFQELSLQDTELYDIDYPISGGDPISRLKLKYSSSQYNGEYRCVVYGVMEESNLKTYSVSDKYMYIYNGEKVAPEFVAQPSFTGLDNVNNLITKSGVSLYCVVSQPEFYPPVQITWYRGSTSNTGLRVPITPSKEIDSKYKLSSDNSTLTFLTYSWYNNGTYHCEATNSEATVVSKDALYQYGGYITITEQLNADSTFSMLCNYSVANTNADTTQVTWYYEESPDQWAPVDSVNISIQNDEAKSASSLTFQNMSLEDVRQYKCLFVKTFNDKDKLAYGFHKPSVCTLQSEDTSDEGGSNSIITVERGEEIVLTCSCAVSLSADATFFFFKDRQSDRDQDIMERYLGTDDYYRLLIEDLSDNKGARMSIPFARQHDKGTYQCGYQIAGEQQRIFVEGGVTVNFKGVLPKSENSPFGFGSYDISSGVWQDIDLLFNGEKVTAEADDSSGAMIMISFPTFPISLGPDIKSYDFTLQSIPDILCKSPFGTNWCGTPPYDATRGYSTDDYSTSKVLFFLPPFSSSFMTLQYNSVGHYINSDEETQKAYLMNKAQLEGRYSINYTINYQLAEGAVLPPYYPSVLSIDLVFPEYSPKTLVAPESRYLVLPASEEMTYELGVDPHMRCNHCKTVGPIKTECPFPHDISPSWSVEGTPHMDESFKDLLTATTTHCNYEGQLGCGDLEINKIDMRLGRTFICTFHYTLPGQTEARQASAKQDVIIENVIPLKHDPQLSSQRYSHPDSAISLPLKRALGKPFTLIVYLDISMSESLYEELVKVKWGVLSETDNSIQWFPHDYRQVNNWQTKRLHYEIANFTDNTTYVCHVSYLNRVMTLQTPVVILDIPPPITDIVGTVNEGDNITFSWQPSENILNNYFIQYKIAVRRKSASPYSKEEEVTLSTFPSRTPSITLDSEHLRAHSVYTVEVVAVYEDGESETISKSVESEEREPGPPSSVVVETNSQKLTDDEFGFLFWLRIDPPVVLVGDIIGYKLELLIRPVEEEDNMTEEKKKRQAGNAAEDKVWTQTISSQNDGFHPNGTFTGEVTFNIESGMENINAIRVSAKTSRGYGEPIETEFVTFETIFSKRSDTWVYVVVALVIIFAVVLGIAVFCYVKRHQQVKKIIKTQYNPLYPIMRSVVPDQWEVNPDDLKLSTALGEGAFGRVMKGALLKEGKTTQVAVKMLKAETSCETEAEALWKEIILMKKVGSHPYIVNIMGCVSVKTPICLLVEFVPNGDLQSFLRSHRIKFEKEHMQNMRKINSNIAKSATKSKQNGGNSDRDADPLAEAGVYSNKGGSPNSEYINLKSPDASYINLQGVEAEEKVEILTSNDMLNMMYQIACGMKYLAYKNIIHRDLAARNILVCEDLTVKVSDFGLARDMYLEGQYMMNPRGRVPFKWMSPEALFDLKFTSKSDVWSYGVLLWEIVTLGGSPYPGIEPAKLYKLLKKGYRMARPDGCSIEIYDVMKDCWQEDPDLRPPFDDLSHTIQQLMSLDSADYLTVGQGIASIVDDEVEEAGAVEILSDEVEVQTAEQYSNVTRTQLSSSSSSSSDQSREVDNPKSPLLEQPNHRQNSVPTGPILRRLNTLDFPDRSPTAVAAAGSVTALRPESNYSASNFISESVL